jgi:hypothetical protein
MNPISFSPATLRQRLEALPARREAATQGNRFAAFQKQAAKARGEVAQAMAAAALADELLPDPAYKELRGDLQRLAKAAAKLRIALTTDASAITTGATSNAFAGLSSSADAALNACKKAWKRGLEAKLKGRAVLAEKLPEILPGAGGELKEKVEQLSAEAQRLLTKPADVERVRGLLVEFDRLAGELRLEGPVGKFLQALAGETGASLAEVRDAEVQKFLTERALWGVFRVRLS